MALISDREAATTYVFSAALVSIIMLFSHVFISKYKQGIHDLEDKDIDGISIFYAKENTDSYFYHQYFSVFS